MLNGLRMVVDEINTRGHLLPLLNGVALTVLFTNEEHEVRLSIHNDALVIDEMGEKEPDVIISGDGAMLHALFLGELKLRKACKDGCLRVRGSIRNVLLIESLFLLALTGVEKEKTDFLKNSG